MAAITLFEVPILAAAGGKPIGSFVCTSPVPQVYLLTFTAPPDNRLVTAFCQAFLHALDIIETSYTPGVVVSTSSIIKFYSNGLDLEHAKSTEGFWTDSLYKLFERLATYSMPTIALMNGHAFAGGLMLAMYHDYRIFNATRGFLCLNELDFGYPLKPAMSAIFKQKVPPAGYRSLVLEAKRFGGKEAFEAGIVDGLGGLEEVLALISERKLTEKGKTGIYGIMKSEMYRETLATIYEHAAEEKRDMGIRDAAAKRLEGARSRVKEWEKNGGVVNKAKL